MAHYKGAATEATRAMHIMKRRERAAEELELKKRKLEEDLKLSTIDNKFSTQNDITEVQLKTSTVGLVTLDQLRERHEIAAKEREKKIAQGALAGSSNLLIKPQEDEKKTNHKTCNSKSLSFGSDDDSDSDSDSGSNITKQHKPNDNSKCAEVNSTTLEDQTSQVSREKSKPSSRLAAISDIDVDTSLLPDQDREQEERKLREKFAEEWREEQERLKQEEIEITFSYWDGSGHRRQVTMKKGDSIFQFLQACLENLRKDFNELRKVTADQLMYVKEDLIIPHHYTFYDFIVTKARGKSGPLFSFDVHEDVRLMGDARVEKDESHAGKVLLRSWFERNKHIFPASRWEPYDRSKTYSKYTISDKRSK